MHSEPRAGLQPNRLKVLLVAAYRWTKLREVFFPSDLEIPAATPRGYQFNQPFGLPVRYHDIKVFSEVSNLDLVEIHLSYKDLEVDINQVLPTRQSIGLVVHAPELFAGDHTLDLCSQDKTYRKRSIAELQRVVDISRDLRRRFQCHEPVLLVAVGGFRNTAILMPRETAVASAPLDGLKQINCAGE